MGTPENSVDTSYGSEFEANKDITPIIINRFEVNDSNEWDAFIAASPNATIFHRAGWMRAVRDHYGHEPYYLLAREGKRIRGVLPLFLVSGPMTGRGLISIPYAVNGGVSADSESIDASLVAEAKEKAQLLQVRYLELRSRVQSDGFTVRDHYYGFRAPLPDDPDLVLNQFPRKARAEVRKARDQYKLTTRFGQDLFGVFYGLYVRSLRRLGSPAHSPRFLLSLMEELGDDCLVQVVYYQGEAVSAVMSFKHKDQILPYFAGIDDKFNKYKVSNFLYFSLMEHAVGLGLRIFDFGRTRRDNIGGCQFKMNQGFEPKPMPYNYYCPQGMEPPDLRPSNKAFSWSQKVWRRLPVSIAGPLGGVVSRWLP